MRISYFLSVYDVFFWRISTVLKESIPQLTSCGISYGKIGPLRIRSQGCDWPEIAIFTDFQRSEALDQAPDMKFLAEKEKELELVNIPFLISSDRYISKLPYEKALRLLELGIRFVESSLERQKPELIVMDDVCCMLSFLIYVIGKKRGVGVWSLGSLKLNHRLSIYDDYLDHREKVNQSFQDLKKRNLNPEESEYAQNYLREYTTQYEPLLYLKTRSKPPRFSFHSLLFLIRLCFHHRKDPADTTRMSFKELVFSRCLRVLRYHAAKWMRLFEIPPQGEKYLFYPLQVQPERSTLILAPFYCDQIALIENISKSMPLGYRLYVKDHPISLGRRPLSEYKRLKQLYNVRLIDTSVPSFGLVKNAAMVISISNTIGIEAIMAEKPLLIFGEPFYKEYDLTTYVDQIKDLPKLIRQTLDQFTPNRELLLKYITALHAGSYKGTRRQPDAVPYVNSWENINNVATALMQEMNQCNLFVS